MLHCRVRLNNIGTNIMAISSGYYGLRKGSTKSHTYSVLNGKQITKDRVEGGKNVNGNDPSPNSPEGEGSGNDNVNDNVNNGGGGDGDE